MTRMTRVAAKPIPIAQADIDSLYARARYAARVHGSVPEVLAVADAFRRATWRAAWPFLSAYALLSLPWHVAGVASRWQASPGKRLFGLIVTGPEAMIAPEAYTVLALVIHEMITNSAKYGSLSDSTGRLTIDIVQNADTSLNLHWRESGGPPVKPPTRRGFGSTIIERSIPFELGGDAKVEYKLSGLEAEFCVPALMVVR